MYERKINFVCTVCSQHFTRKSGAKRHSNTIHAGDSLFVSLLDYIIGRVERRYQPSDPWLYRKKRTLDRNVKNISSLDNRNNATPGNNIPDSQFTTFADETNKNPYYGMGVATKNVRSDFNREIDRTILEKSSGPWLNDMQRNDVGLNGIDGKEQNGDNSLSFSVLRISKELLELRELIVLVQKYHDKETSNDILDCVKYAYNIGRVHAVEIDKWLPFLRNLDKCTVFS
jgi:hypothetical protein